MAHTEANLRSVKVPSSPLSAVPSHLSDDFEKMDIERHKPDTGKFITVTSKRKNDSVEAAFSDSEDEPLRKRNRRDDKAHAQVAPAHNSYSESSATEPEPITPDGAGPEEEILVRAIHGRTNPQTSRVVRTALSEPTDERPLGHAEPPVWSFNRRALCDSLPYFKAHQGSLYTKDNVAQGLLLDGGGLQGDHFGSRVIIWSLGGGNFRTHKDGEFKGKTYRREDARPRATKALQAVLDDVTKDLIVVAGSKQPLFPCKPPYPYSVLGHFRITDIWAEPHIEDGYPKSVIVYRVRLQRIDTSTTAWWTPTQGPDLDKELAQAYQGQTAPVSNCPTCRQPSKEIFEHGWTCLERDCESFFKFAGSQDRHSGRDLKYSPRFLAEQTPISPNIQLRSLIPPLPQEGAGQNGTELACRVGAVCPKCNSCSSRVFWNRWECENPMCDWKQMGRITPVSVDEIRQETMAFDQKLKHPLKGDKITTLFNKKFFESIETPVGAVVMAGIPAQVYFLLDPQGNVIGACVVFRSNDIINARPGGPDEIWTELQNDQIDFRRNPVQAAKSRTEILTRHYQQNWGAKYKFVSKVQSRGFNEAPDSILKTVMRLTWAGRIALWHTSPYFTVQPAREDINLSTNSTHVDDDDTEKVKRPKSAAKRSKNLEEMEKPQHNKAKKRTRAPKAPYVLPMEVPRWTHNFNELLSLAYMEKDSISYHDDGEKELGPIVATFSLGGPSIMKIRPKANKLWVAAPVKKVKAAKKEHVEDMKDEEVDEDQRPEQVAEEDEAKGLAPVLAFALRHGDMAVMVGHGVQYYYDHAVIPAGNRRYALTCRYMDPERMDNEGDRLASLRDGAIPERAEKFAYHGELFDHITEWNARTSA